MIYDGKKININIGNFLDFGQDELTRGISVVLDFQLLTPPSQLSISQSSDWTVIGSLTSEFQLGLLFRGTDRALAFGYLSTNDAWVFNTEYLSFVPFNKSLVYILNFTRSVAQPKLLTITFTDYNGTTYKNGNQRFSSKHSFHVTNKIVSRGNMKIDPVKSPENWEFSFGEPSNTGTNFYFIVNRIFLFKGLVEIMNLGSNSAVLSSESNNSKCTMELTGSEHMICLECLDSIYAILPDKMACLPASTVGKNLGPPKEGVLHPNLRVYCPEGHAYLPLVDGEACVQCTNDSCSRCLREDLGKCLGCKTENFLRIDANNLCTNSPCAPNQYLTSAEGTKCLTFELPGCNKSDNFGWCSKVSGEGCTVLGRTFHAGICCTQSFASRFYSDYPGTCISCHSSCKTCSGNLDTQCTSCPTFQGVRQNGTSCQPCTSPTCLKCDTDPNICEMDHTPQTCVDRCLAGNCPNQYQCNPGGCEPGYFLDQQGKCLLCQKGCATCSTQEDCLTCRENFTPSGSNCNCSSPKIVNFSVKPSLCISTCPASCEVCLANNICQKCKNEFQLQVSGCVCRNTNWGFRLVSASVCERCQHGCKQCFDSIGTCSGTECRAGYIDFPRCVCPIENGFRENIYVPPGEPNLCEPCTAGVGCHSCQIDRSICSGCRKNYDLASNTCVCPVDRGFILNQGNQPETCECEEKSRYISYETLPPTCLPCHSSCSTCGGSLYSQCQSCGVGRILSPSPVGSCPVNLSFELQQVLRGEQSMLSDIVV